jgi:hypothetical protein
MPQFPQIVNRDGSPSFIGLLLHELMQMQVDQPALLCRSRIPCEYFQQEKEFGAQKQEHSISDRGQKKAPGRRNGIWDIFPNWPATFLPSGR